MSSINFLQLSSNIGKGFSGPIEGVIGKYIGTSLVNHFAKKDNSLKIGTRLHEVTTQTKRYGITIPIVFGTVKLAGNINMGK